MTEVRPFLSFIYILLLNEYLAISYLGKHKYSHCARQRLSYFVSRYSTLYCDNQGAIRLSKDATFHGRTKHIDVHFHFIHQTVSSGNVELIYIPTENMTADIFTKALAHVKFEKFRDDLNVM